MIPWNGIGPEPMDADEWAEWLREAGDDELREVAKGRCVDSASDAENELQNRAERAEERQREAYYGGSSPQTDRERAEVDDLYCGKPYPHFDSIGPDGESK